MSEIEISDLSKLPKNVYHLVPQNLFDNFIDSNGKYDCRNKKEWGNNSPFIHTSPTKKQLKERVADANWIKYPLNEEFILLKIDTKKIKDEITYSVINDNIYHHIWGVLPKGSFQKLKVKRTKDGKFKL